MARLLMIILLAVPLIEIGLFVLVGRLIGLWPTLLGVLVTAMIGTAVVRRQGGAILAEMRRGLAQGQLPARSMGDGMMIALGGLLLALPGYFTDCIGFLLLVPAVRRWLQGRLARHVGVTVTGSAPGFAQRGASQPGTIDLDADEWRRE
jgi:UPF0716 protein FxsA